MLAEFDDLMAAVLHAIVEVLERMDGHLPSSADEIADTHLRELDSWARSHQPSTAKEEAAHLSEPAD